MSMSHTLNQALPVLTNVSRLSYAECGNRAIPPDCLHVRLPVCLSVSACLSHCRIISDYDQEVFNKW